MRFTRAKLVFVVSLLLAVSLVMYSQNAPAYYGGLTAGIPGSGLYGLYGLFGGEFSPYGPYYGLYGGLAGLYGLGGAGFTPGAGQLIRQAQAPLTTTTTLVPVLPNPTGSWSGTWVSYVSLKSGVADFQLLYTPGTLVVSGTAGLLLNKLVPVPISVSGLNSATGFTLTGTYFDLNALVNYTVDYTCTLSSPSFITGTYIIHDPLYLQVDTGTVGLTLANPIPIIV
ncbi:MAG: hypothetical protein AB1611_09490 [bacterium]